SKAAGTRGVWVGPAPDGPFSSSPRAEACGDGGHAEPSAKPGPLGAAEIGLAMCAPLSATGMKPGADEPPGRAQGLGPQGTPTPGSWAGIGGVGAKLCGGGKPAAGGGFSHQGVAMPNRKGSEGRGAEASVGLAGAVGGATTSSPPKSSSGTT